MLGRWHDQQSWEGRARMRRVYGTDRFDRLPMCQRGRTDYEWVYQFLSEERYFFLLGRRETLQTKDNLQLARWHPLGGGGLSCIES